MPSEAISKPPPDPATRLYFIVARRSPMAVVFRRGPTRQVELLSWNLETDEITPGQWLKGRIYERRCDLSPSGKYFIYFAAKYETGMRTWTAISRPPYLTALALWPKGDAWGGGGLFISERQVALNHRPTEQTLDPAFQVPRELSIRLFGEHPGWGEDLPIHHERIVRDGWEQLGAEPAFKELKPSSDPWIVFDPPIRYRRPIGPSIGGMRLEMAIDGLKEQGGPWYLTRYALIRGAEIVRDLGRADWADTGPNGDLLLARDGRLFRLDAGDDLASTQLREIADLRGHRFAPREAPAAMVRWE